MINFLFLSRYNQKMILSHFIYILFLKIVKKYLSKILKVLFLLIKPVKEGKNIVKNFEMKEIGEKKFLKYNFYMK
jgi:hypothetical protein